MGRHALLVSILFLVSCKSDPPPPQPAPSNASASSPSLTDDDVRQALEAMGRDVLHAQRLAERVNPLWDHLHDEERNVDRMLDSARKIGELATAAAKSTPSPSSTSACAKQIEGAASQYMHANITWSADLVVWLQSNRTKLAAQLARGTFPDTCGEKAIGCAAIPDQNDEKYGPRFGAGFGRVSSITCTQDLFMCGRKPDAICEVYVLKQKLGLERDSPKGFASSRISGRDVNLTWKEPPWAK